MLSRSMLIAFTLALVGALSNPALAGGGKRGKKPDNPNVFKWEDSLDDAEDEANTTHRPIMLVIVNSYRPEDYKQVEKLISWPYAVVGSRRDYVAVRGTIESQELKAMLERMQIKSLPVLCWMDHYGNPVSIQNCPTTPEQLEAFPKSWQSVQPKVDKFFKDHLDRGDRYLKINKLKEGYNEYGLITAFKGPLCEKARESQKKVKEQWKKLVSIARTSPPKERAVILSGVTREISGTDLEREMMDDVTAAMNASGDTVSKPVAPPADTAVAKEAPKTDAPPPPAVADVPQPPPAQPKAPEPKTLADLANASSSFSPAPAEPDGSQLGSVLLTKNDPKLKEASTLIAAAVASYRQAVADATDRGEARNNMLKTAHEKFSQAMDIIDAANTVKPDAQLDKVLQDVSMMMYGCLKYQSL